MYSLPRNPRYRGVYRRPVFSADMHAAGFDDPYLFSEDVSDEGLISSMSAARMILRRFAATEAFPPLEIIEAISEPPLASTEDQQHAGFDVAGKTADFWSIVADFPTQLDADFAARLNRDGLFDRYEDARRFREAYQALQLGDHDVPITIWSIRLIEDVA